jgi:predicted nucleic acid-binding protein
MRVLVDTNIILDVLLQREPLLAASSRIMGLSERREVDAFITATSATDLFYIMRKEMDKEQAKEALEKIIRIIGIVSVTRSDLIKALALEFSDFEDALQAQCAVKLKADLIVTRNVKDFRTSPVPAVTPEKFLGDRTT